MSTHTLPSNLPDHLLDSNQRLRPNLPRSISTTNLETTSRCRRVIQNDWKAKAPHGGTNYFATTPAFTLILPALGDYPKDFQKFVFNRIVAKGMQETMEEEFCLNWCPNVTKLVPLNTIGDGNCLLHAASLAMWGFQDRDLVLRRAVSCSVNDDIQNNTLYQRWKHNREMENQEYGIELEPNQWDCEWQMVKQQTSTTVLSGQNLESLDEFHVFVLANVLRRPIIMYAAPKLRSYQSNGTLQKVNFHGIYLPLLWAPDSCKKDPLPLAYHLGHFSALVVVESLNQYRHGHLLLALSDYYSRRLPVRFILPVEDPDTLLMDYLDLIQVPSDGSPYFSHGNIISAKLMISDVPSYLKPLISGFVDACYETYTAQMQQTHSTGELTDMQQMRPRCINNCGMYGDPATGLCSKCHQKAIGAAQAQEKAVEEKVPRQAQEQFAVAEQQATITGAIKCPRCCNPGHPSYLGMCEQCFVSTSTSQNILSSASNVQQQHSQESVIVKDPVYEVLPNYHNEPQEVQSPKLLCPSPPAVPPPRNIGDRLIERSQCRTPSCEFYGTKETRFYCSKCFDANMEAILKEVDNSSTTTHPLQSQPQYQTTGGSGLLRLTTSVVSPGLSHFDTISDVQMIQDPPMCYRCDDFFANDEYNGLCHRCFMMTTKTESQDTTQHVKLERSRTGQTMNPSQQYKPPQVTCSTKQCDNPAIENGFCEYCNAVAVGSSKGYHTQPIRPFSQQSGSQTAPVPKPRSRTKFSTQSQSQLFSERPQLSTAPVGNLTTSMATISLTSSESSCCFLCDGGSTIGSTNFVCEHHARIIQQAVYSKPEPEQTMIDKQKVSPSPYEEPYCSRARERRKPINSGNSIVTFGVPLPPNQYNAGSLLPGVREDRSISQAKKVMTRSSESQSQTADDQLLLSHSFGSQAAAGVGTCGKNQAVDINPAAKTLCATPGCSFKGYEELQKLCPDCYQEKYGKAPSQDYPLV